MIIVAFKQDFLIFEKYFSRNIMKQKLFFILFLLISITSKISAQETLKFDESNFSSVLLRSKTEKKPIFLMLYATWCPHCENMKKTVLNDSEVARFFNSNFICTWQDIDKSEGKMLKEKYQLRATPEFLFIDENDTVLYAITGEFKSIDLISEAKMALNPSKQLPFLENQFKNNPTNAEKCLAYMMILKKAKDRTELSPIADQYLKSQTDSELVSELNFRIISYGVTDIKSREFQYLLNHQKEFAAVTSKIRVERKLSNIVTELLKPYTMTYDSINYKKQREIAKTINNQRIDSLIFIYDISISGDTKNWKSYRKTCNESVKKYVWSNKQKLKQISENYLNNITTIPDLKNALKWSQRAAEIDESYDDYVLISKLHLKLKDKKLAIIAIQKAKEMTSKLGKTSKEVVKMYKELGLK